MKFSLLFESPVAGVAQRLIQGDGHRVGEVQGALALRHRDPDAAVRIPDQNLFRNFRALFSEHREVSVPVVPFVSSFLVKAAPSRTGEEHRRIIIVQSAHPVTEKPAGKGKLSGWLLVFGDVPCTSGFAHSVQSIHWLHVVPTVAAVAAETAVTAMAAETAVTAMAVATDVTLAP